MFLLCFLFFLISGDAKPVDIQRNSFSAGIERLKQIVFEFFRAATNCFIFQPRRTIPGDEGNIAV